MTRNFVVTGLLAMVSLLASACATHRVDARIGSTVPSPASGERVRVRLLAQPRAVEGAVDRQLLRGTLVGVTGDSLLLRIHSGSGVTAIARTGIDRLEISRGVRSRLESAAVEGAALAATFSLQRVLFSTLDRDRYDESTWESAAIGAAAGGILGIIVGAVRPRERWERLRSW